MNSPRWRKVLRDLWLGRGRAALMIVAIAAGNTGVGGILTAYAIVSREMSRNYLGTNPAAATLEMDSVDDALVREVRARPGIAAAEARTSLLARVRIGPDTWRPLLLFVVEDFDAMRVSTVAHRSGAWPPPVGTMLAERSALGMLDTGEGQTVVVRTPNGAPREIAISGVVHDPSLAPAWQERAGYGYVTPETLRWLGESGTLDELKIAVDDPSASRDAIEQTARDLAVWLAAGGHTVREIQVPTPRKHPHQSQMTAVMALLLAFAAMALVLSAVLVASLVGGMMAEQVRQIGMMKAVGARTRQIAGLYLVFTGAIAVAALACAIPAGLAGGRMFAATIANLLNLQLASMAAPWWIFAVQAAAGLLVPIAVAIGPVVRGSRVTVREALGDYGVRAEATEGGLDAWLGRMRGLDRTTLMAVRNALRRRRRLALNLLLLAAGGAMFMTGLNVSAAWWRNLDEGLARRHYDVEVRFNRPEPAAALVERIRAVPGVAAVEAWGYAPAAVYRPGEVDVVHTYPDRGHGSFSVRGVPASSTFVDFPVVAGRWLQPGDTDAVVLNEYAYGQMPEGVGLGDEVTLSIDGRPSTWRVAGIVHETGAPATAYMADAALAEALGAPGTARSLRVVSARQDDAGRAETIRGVEHALAEADASVSLVMADAELRTAIGEHIRVLIVALLSMAVLMAIVGGVGLAATLTASVVERTREFGVLRTIGGTPATIVRIVVTESLVVGALSWFGAVAGSLPLSWAVGAHLGAMAFRTPLPLAIALRAPLIWFGIVVATSVLASALPAWRASRRLVREALSFV